MSHWEVGQLKYTFLKLLSYGIGLTRKAVCRHNFSMRIAHVFFPHRSNNHRARLLRPSALGFFVALIILLHAIFNFVAVLRPGVLGTVSSISVDEVVKLTNQRRSEHGLSPLRMSDQLTQAAHKKGEDMLANNYWAHVSPSGREPWAFISDSGYSYRYAGENLAKDYSDAQAVVDAWMNSPSHKDNLLKKEYEDIGVAVVTGTLNGYATVLVVQLFGSPQPGFAVSRSQAQPKPIPLSPVSLGNELVDEQQEVPAPQRPAPSQSSTDRDVVVLPRQGAPTTFLSQTKGASVSFPPAINVFGFTKSITLILALVMVFVLGLDYYVAVQGGVVRSVGKNWAHMMYLLVLAGAVWFTSSGAIL